MTTHVRKGREAAVARKFWAGERVTERAKRTPKEQLARLDAGGHRALRERARLEKKVEKAR